MVADPSKRCRCRYWLCARHTGDDHGMGCDEQEISHQTRHVKQHIAAGHLTGLVPQSRGKLIGQFLVQPVKEPLQSAAGNAKDKDTAAKRKDEEPYAEDTMDDSAQVTGSSEGGSGVWGWIKGLGGSKGQRSAHEIYKVSSDTPMLCTALGGTCDSRHWQGMAPMQVAQKSGTSNDAQATAVRVEALHPDALCLIYVSSTSYDAAQLLGGLSTASPDMAFPTSFRHQWGLFVKQYCQS